MDEAIVGYLQCPACRRGALVVNALERNGAELITAVVTCAECETWYRVEDGLLELLVPSLRLPEVDAAFRRRVVSLTGSWNYQTQGETDAGDEHKLGQKTFYDDDASSYEIQLMRLPFWRSFDRAYIARIQSMAGRGTTMVEIGGGSGRLSIPMHGHFGLVLSFDISEAMVRRAMSRRDALSPRPKNLHYFVADAENIPIRSGIADITIFSGILHHVAAPDRVIQEAVRTLGADGRLIGMENNRSFFRPIFDWLMRMKKLWNEKAHPEHFVISSRELERWLADAGINGTVWTSVFIPPHVFSAFPLAWASRLLAVTDALGRAIPWIRKQGGLILFAGEVAGGGGPHDAVRVGAAVDRARGTA